jgi:hypothetical protein
MTLSASRLIAPRGFTLVIFALAAQLLLVAQASHAQSGEATSSQSGESTSPASDAHIREVTDLPVVEIRPEEEIRKIRSETEERLKDLQGDLQEAKSAQESGRARVEVQKKAIEKMKADYKLASKQGTAVPKKTAEAQVKRAESALKLIEQYDKTLSAKIEAFEAQRESQQALLDALDRELAVSTLNREMAELVQKEGLGAGARLGSMQNELTKLEESSLDGLKKRVEKEKTASEKLYKLMEERVKFAKMRTDFLAGK